MPHDPALSRSLRGSIAHVTGAGSGMGRATAHLFADEGARVVLSDLDPDFLLLFSGMLFPRYPPPLFR